MKREFLGWEGALLAKAAAWLVGEFGSDLGGVVVALPGARAGRILEELLAREVGAELRPPKVVTAGVLSDELLVVEGAAASRLVRTLAWERALRGLSQQELGKVVARPPGDQDQHGWAMLAEEVRGLFGEVAAEGLDFGAVAGSPVLSELESERQRWLVLARAQASMAEGLRAAGLHDPHLGRLAAIQSRSVAKPRAVVLVGVVEMNELLRRTLALCESPQAALIFAPEDEAHSLDELGCLVPEAWATRETSLSLEHWRVADRPVDQARETARVLAEWGGKYRAEEISIGLADAEVSPYLRSRLAESGVRARDAAGVAMARTAPARLLSAVDAFLRTRSFSTFASLVRHPDLEWALLRVDGKLEPLEILDEYHRRHLPWRADGKWSAEAGAKHDQALRGRMNDLWRAAREVLGELHDAGTAGVSSQTSALRSFLERVYGGREIDPGPESGRVLIASLRCLAGGLEEIEALPANLAPEGTMAEAIELLLRATSSKSNDVAPAAARAGEPTIEMMGWLELPLDDAPALVVTGFEDGKVPESVRGDAYLPNRLRSDLGLVDNDQRLARDLYATELLLNSRRDIAFISGRRSLAGDPQVPSRVVFHCPEDEVAPRVRRFLSPSHASVARVEPSSEETRALPRGAQPAAPETITVSAFKTFLTSPYAYYLKHVLRLETLDDRGREMDGASFGNLAHAVLQRFGLDARARDERDADKICAFLEDTLGRLSGEVYGERPLPAVQLQLEQLALRLRAFAKHQARRRAEGWCIHAVEWAPEGGTVELLVDGQPVKLKGRVDRIDRNESTGEWAVWDYKTGDSIRKPVPAHRAADGSWKDLQLPLYCLLVMELLGDARPKEIGYIAVGRDEDNVGFWPVRDWRRPKTECDDSDEALSGAIEVAHEVVRRIRSGALFELDGWRPYEEIFGAIGGVGLLATTSVDEEPA